MKRKYESELQKKCELCNGSLGDPGYTLEFKQGVGPTILCCECREELGDFMRFLLLSKVVRPV